jgi:hypothetical protein
VKKPVRFKSVARVVKAAPKKKHLVSAMPPEVPFPQKFADPQRLLISGGMKFGGFATKAERDAAIANEAVDFPEDFYDLIAVNHAREIVQIQAGTGPMPIGKFVELLNDEVPNLPEEASIAVTGEGKLFLMWAERETPAQRKQRVESAIRAAQARSYELRTGRAKAGGASE